jgi:hypothetical protein
MRDEWWKKRKTSNLLNPDFPSAFGTEGTKPEIATIGKYFLLQAHAERNRRDCRDTRWKL